jgi:hypothetical protein
VFRLALVLSLVRLCSRICIGVMCTVLLVNPVLCCVALVAYGLSLSHLLYLFCVIHIQSCIYF